MHRRKELLEDYTSALSRREIDEIVDVIDSCRFSPGKFKIWDVDEKILRKYYVER